MIKRFFLIFSMITMLVCPSWAQTGSANRIQSGIVAAISGAVKIVSDDIGSLPETGQKVYLNDVIETGDSGKLQILLLDRTTITIGPNTSIIIDEFVFDPGVTRSLEATVLKGAFKLASSTMKLKNPEKRVLNMPNAVISIRGTELIGTIQDQVQNVVLLDGAITVANDGYSQDIDRPSFGVSINPAGEISLPSFVTSEDLGLLLDQIEGGAEKDEAAPQTQAEADAESEATESEQAEEVAETEETAAPTETAEATAEPETSIAEQTEAPTEAEIVSAAEAIADGSADINDLQTLSKADPENISTVARILGLEVDEATGEVKPSEDAPFLNNVEALLNAETDIDGEAFVEGLPLEALTTEGEGLSRADFAERLSSFGTLEAEGAKDAPGVEINSSSILSSGFEDTARAPEPQFIDAPVFIAPVTKVDDTALNTLFEFASFDRDRGFGSFKYEPRQYYFEPLEDAGFEDASFEDAGFEDASFEDDGIEVKSDSAEASLETQSILEPVAKESETELSVLSLTRPESGAEEPIFEDSVNIVVPEAREPELTIELTPIIEEPDVTIDDLVTDALENVIENISSKTLPIPENTFMPESNSYRSWSSFDWYYVARNFSSGTINFEHVNEIASHHSGSYCTSCSATVSSVLNIDFRAMKYQFSGKGVFNKPGYNSVSFSETTPEISLGKWELSTGTISTLPNARELESTYDNPTVHTLTSSTDPSDTVSATIDLDFVYDAQLSNNRDLSSNLGVFGLQEVEYTESGSSEVTFRTEEEAMTPVE